MIRAIDLDLGIGLAYVQALTDSPEWQPKYTALVRDLEHACKAGLSGRKD